MGKVFSNASYSTDYDIDKSIDHVKLMKKLEKPKGRIDVVLDTDTFNEVDDQFAMAYMFRSDEKLDVKAVYATPFLNEKSDSPEDGMNKSYDEILKLLDLLERNDFKDKVYKGSSDFMSSETEPIISDAASDLAKRAMEYSEEKPLYVVAIGAITNIASALLINPEIRDRIVVVWLGGNAHHWHWNVEFNLTQDIDAARVLFGCGVAVVQLPCMGVVSAFSISGPELKEHLQGKNKLADYLATTVFNEVKKYDTLLPTWTRTIWDVTAVAWLLDEDFMSSSVVPSPIPEYTHRYSFDSNRHPIRYVNAIHRDYLYADLIEKILK